MPENITIGAFVLGAILILIAILGGNFKLFGAEIASTVSSGWLRFVAFILGTALIIVALDIKLPLPATQLERKYEILKKDLRVKNWQSADTQTMNILLEEATKIRLDRKPTQNWLDPGDITVLPCPDLSNINQLWAESSNNRFGLFAQSKVWKSVGGTTATEPDNPSVRKNFSTRVGWQGADKVPLTLEKLFQAIPNKNITEIPEGYLPSAIGQYRGNAVLVGNYNEFAALSGRLQQCRISK
jgi:GUN4-like